MDKRIQWNVIDKTGIIIWDGDFTVIPVNGVNYISVTDSYDDYQDLYDIIENNLMQFNLDSIRLTFYHKDKDYCISQVQKMKNRYKNNFPKHVYINGDSIEFNYYESIFDILAEFYKKYE